MSKEDAQHTIGTIHGEIYERDAIHIAVIQVIAKEDLRPGTHVGFNEGGQSVTANPVAPYKKIGIIDPFLTQNVLMGERFWMVLYPNC